METQISTPQTDKQAPIETLPSKPLWKSKFLWAFLALSFLAAFVIGGIMVGGKSIKKQSPSPSPISQKKTITPTPDPTANWKTYTYKNTSFKYPLDWKVYFDSVVAGQPNGFSLHVQRADAAQGYQPLELILTTFNDGRTYKNVPAKTFQQNAQNGDLIQFKSPDGTQVYALCYFGLNGQDTLNICNQILSTFKSTNPTTTQSYLSIPKFGVKIPLTDPIKDAYSMPLVTTGDGTSSVYLRVHSLDSEHYCNNDNFGIAALTQVKKDEMNPRTGQKYSDSGLGTTVGDYYYFIDGEQAVCSQDPSNIPVETNARTSFLDSSKKIIAL